MISKLKEFIGVGIVFGGTSGIFLMNLAIDYYIYPDNKIKKHLKTP
tara:strand:- start:1176 stop:1313 length:138 start_codon:yes stop_codon:yes gene_type:complete